MQSVNELLNVFKVLKNSSGFKVNLSKTSATIKGNDNFGKSNNKIIWKDIPIETLRI